jgi:hypothetical protein
LAGEDRDRLDAATDFRSESMNATWTWKRAGDSDPRIVTAAAADRLPTPRTQLAPTATSDVPLLPWRLPASVRRHRPQRRS